MIRVADYIVERVAEYGIGYVFMVTGGAVMNLNNVFGMGILDREGSRQSGTGLRNRAVK
jgi:hypothetical protein